MQTNNDLKEIDLLQKAFCSKSEFPYEVLNWNHKVGISKNFDPSNYPINGLRHKDEHETTGWYIWSGEFFSENDDFFEPVHAFHLVTKYPELMKYLGLPAGYRFLLDPNRSVEDIWYDEKLII